MKRFIPNAVTLASAISGSAAIFLCIAHSPLLASSLLLLAVVLDGMDGTLARKLGVTSEMGGSLDSLADIVAFGVAPAVLVVSQFPASSLLMAAGTVFVACGIFRLARFSVLPKGPAFVGMPITVNGLLFPLLTFIGANEWISFAALAVMAALMVSTIRVPRFL